MTLRVWSISLVKDEADVFRYTLDHLLEQELDGILIADNMSTDGTRELIHSYARRYPKLIIPLDDKEKAWFQSRKMSELARLAHERGADWILPCDADEWYRMSDGTPVGDTLRRYDPIGPNVVRASVTNYFATGRDDTSDPNPYSRMQRREAPIALGKVAFRWQDGIVIADGNHSVQIGNERLTEYEIGLEMRHIPYRSADQFAKGVVNGYAAMKATGWKDDRGGHWWLYGRHLDANGEEGLRDWWREHFYFPIPEREAKLIHDPIPLRTMVRA